MRLTSVRKWTDIKEGGKDFAHDRCSSSLIDPGLWKAARSVVGIVLVESGLTSVYAVHRERTSDGVTVSFAMSSVLS